MRRTLSLLAVFLLALSSAIDLGAASIAGVVLPDTAQLAGKTLVLNGLGLRTKYLLNIYVAGLYLERKSTDPNAILRPDGPRYIVMHYMRGLSKSQITAAFIESYDEYESPGKESLKPDLERLLALLEPMEKGDQMVFTYLPGKGTTMYIKGKEKLTIAGPGFGQMLLSVWLGPNTTNAPLKKRLLGL